MVAQSNALIGDTSQMSYRAQGPGQLPSSAEAIQSQMKGGQRFSAADQQATQALLTFIDDTNKNIENFANQAEQSKNTYMTADEESRAKVESVVRPAVSVGPNAGGTPNG
jgi:hypothetical protein